MINTYSFRDGHLNSPSSGGKLKGCMSALAQTGKADGEIRKFNKEGSELTIKHGPFEGIEMGGMTMILPVKDRAILEKVKA